MANGPRVGIISDERYPSAFTDTQQVMKNATALARAGLDVELLIPRPLHRRGWSAARAHAELAAHYSLRGPVPVREVFTVPTGSLRVEKLTHGVVAPLSFALRRFDLIYSRNVIPAMLTLALGKKLVFETYRAWGYEQPKLVQRLGPVLRHERFVGTITHSAYAARSLVEQGYPADKVVVLHNGYDPADFEPRLAKAEARRAIGFETERPLLVYTGNMQPNKGVETAIDVAARLPEIELLLVGGQPAHLRRLEGYAAELGARNVTFTGHQRVGDVPTYLAAADVLVVPPTGAPLKTHGRTVLPMKLFVYLAAGRPILGPDLPDQRGAHLGRPRGAPQGVAVGAARGLNGKNFYTA